ncbi:MAG: hypothetical protein NTX29_01965, partial [Actinobacteria bacterium]|nr:hypothetical protein [Actinomycetota bacterium]
MQSLNNRTDSFGGKAFQDQDDLVAAAAQGDVTRPQYPSAGLPEFAQGLIAGEMALCVVERLEIVEFDDDEAALANTAIDPARIAVCGSSLGGYYSARAASMEPRIAA